MHKVYFSFPRNVYLLFLVQIIGGAASSIVSLLGSLIGADIAPSPALATLPGTTMIIGLAAGTIPAALLMKKIGRKNGFLCSSLLAFCAAILAAIAVSHQLFYLLCVSAFFIGFYSAFVQQYRFAASESVQKSSAGKAVGFILFAGIISGIIGPEIATLTKNTFSLPQFSGSFIFLAGLFAISAILLLFLKDTHVSEEKVHVAERSIREIISQPRFLVAIVAGATSYSIMSFIMGAVPIQLHSMVHYSVDSIVLMTQSHIVGMYFPSLFTGWFIERLGIYRVLLSGIGTFCLAIVFAVFAHSSLFYWAVAVLIGIGWNFLYISSTVLLSQSHTHTERFKAQGLNDFIVFISQVVASFLVGTVLFMRGWVSLNLFALPLILISFLVFTAYRKRIQVK